MKKLIALLLVAVMALGMVACGNTNNDNGATETTGAKVEAPASALEVLEKTWALYAEDEKFFAMGGFKLDEEGVPVSTDGAPGVVEDADFLAYTLLVPETQAANVTEAASIMHAMNANTFTCGAYKVSDVAGFSAAMKDAIQNNRWMCGFPEKLLIADIGGVVVVAFGHGDVMGVFQGHLTTAYAGASILVDEAIG